MAMEINSIYNNVYENTYAAQKQENVKKNENSKMEETQKNSGTESSKLKSTAEYMKGLEKLAPSVEFRIGNSYATDKTGKTLTINPQLLEKMQNDPKMEKKMKELIAGVEKMTKFDESRCRANGRVVVYKHSYIDANGKYCHTAMTIKKDELNEKLRKQAEENAKKQVEKNRENARKRTEQLEEKLEEKSEEAKNSQSTSDGIVLKSVAAQDKAEEISSKKLGDSGNKESYLDNREVKLNINAAKEKNKCRKKRMASDEKYEQKYMKNIQGALRMSEQINREFGFESAYGKRREKARCLRLPFPFIRMERHLSLQSWKRAAPHRGSG